MASAEQPTGPPKKGQGPKPSFVQAFVAPKGVVKSLDVPVSQLSPALEADKTLFAARDKAQGLRKRTAPIGGRSVPSVQVSFPSASASASASASVDKPKPFTLAGLLSNDNEEAPAAEAEEGPAPSIKVSLPPEPEATEATEATGAT